MLVRTAPDTDLSGDMRNFLVSAVVLLVCLARQATGWATITDNGYENLVVAISPDVTISLSILTYVLLCTISRYLRTPRLWKI